MKTCTSALGTAEGCLIPPSILYTAISLSSRSWSSDAEAKAKGLTIPEHIIASRLIGDIVALLPSSVEFIEKASGIKSRHVMNKSGILDPAIMHPVLPERPNDQISILADGGRGGRGRNSGLGETGQRKAFADCGEA